jgi:acetaldehyde dehydrogenase (acetylating)
VNTPTTHGSIGLTTGLDPAMTLGCGGWGGNITVRQHLTAAPVEPQTARVRDPSADGIGPSATSVGRRRRAGHRRQARQFAEGAREAREQGHFGGNADRPRRSLPDLARVSSRPRRPRRRRRSAACTRAAARGRESPVGFVCEDDVRAALKEGGRS